MNDAVTKLIKSRGWTVKDACELLGIEYTNFRRKCRRILNGNAKNANDKAQLLCMCRGLKLKRGSDENV